jgi:Exostosin family
MKFFLTCTEQEAQAWGMAGADLPEQLRAEYSAAGMPFGPVVEDPAQADVIVFCEPIQEAEQIWAPKLRGNSLVRQFPEKCYIISQEDQPIPFLPGVYVSLRAPWADPKLHRTWQYRFTMNPLIEDSAEVAACQVAPTFLASFSGAATHPIRAKLFNLYANDPRFDLRETKNLQFNVNPSSQDKKQGQRGFIKSMLAARFSLCPRGFGANSYRIQESMALSRAPVVIGDDWVPPKGIDWSSFAIFVSSDRIPQLADILSQRAEEFEVLGKQARAVWEQNFQPSLYAVKCLGQIKGLQESGARLSGRYRAHWEHLLRNRMREMNPARYQGLKGRLRIIKSLGREALAYIKN